MQLTSFINTFDVFATCFIYGSISYILLLLFAHLILCWLTLFEDSQELKSDFYEQVKELLNPATEKIMELDNLQPQSFSFELMTIRELRSYIKDNQLQQYISHSLGKTVSNARKYELINSLNTFNLT